MDGHGRYAPDVVRREAVARKPLSLESQRRYFDAIMANLADHEVDAEKAARVLAACRNEPASTRWQKRRVAVEAAGVAKLRAVLGRGEKEHERLHKIVDPAPCESTCRGKSPVLTQHYDFLQSIRKAIKVRDVHEGTLSFTSAPAGEGSLLEAITFLFEEGGLSHREIGFLRTWKVGTNRPLSEQALDAAERASISALGSAKKELARIGGELRVSARHARNARR